MGLKSEDKTEGENVRESLLMDLTAEWCSVRLRRTHRLVNEFILQFIVHTLLIHYTCS